ncbi:uncharacterized protein M6B38_131420 [Iris pallida]|uniref:Uncharacterized protein n=1 Tax=Iris pallida TaxID=29817 RepID=A0AAX6G0E2_IRIPA|nr:uncharacterized protein M6B38_131420 [Iris pallida]
METPGPATRGSTKLKRKPFSDLTNTPSLSSPNPKSKPNPKPGYVPEPETSDPQPLPVPSTSGDQENDWDQQGTPLKFKEVSADLCNNADNNDEAKISTVYTRIKARRKLKGKVIKSAPSLSCPPVGKK